MYDKGASILMHSSAQPSRRRHYSCNGKSAIQQPQTCFLALILRWGMIETAGGSFGGCVVPMRLLLGPFAASSCGVVEVFCEMPSPPRKHGGNGTRMEDIQWESTMSRGYSGHGIPRADAHEPRARSFGFPPHPSAWSAPQCGSVTRAKGGHGL